MLPRLPTMMAMTMTIATVVIKMMAMVSVLGNADIDSDTDGDGDGDIDDGGSDSAGYGVGDNDRMVARPAVVTMTLVAEVATMPTLIITLVPQPFYVLARAEAALLSASDLRLVTLNALLRHSQCSIAILMSNRAKRDETKKPWSNNWRCIC